MIDVGSIGFCIYVYKFNNCGVVFEFEDEVFFKMMVKIEG